MTNGPWIDGSVALPKVGDFIKWVHFYRDRDGQTVATVPGVALVVNPNDWVTYHYRVVVSKIVVDTIPYVPPVAPLPELAPTRDYGPTEEFQACDLWHVTLQDVALQRTKKRIDTVMPVNVKHECRATARRMFNAAVKAMRGEG